MLYAHAPMKSLAGLEKIHREYGPGRSAAKVEAIRSLQGAQLPSARAVLRFHEVLLFLRAFPDDRAVLAAVERALDKFENRHDLARFRKALLNSGIAGTDIRYRFFWPMARWLAQHWPERLRYSDDAFDDFEPRLRAALPLLVSPLQAEAIKRTERSTAEILDRLRGKSTAAAWVVERIESLSASETIREWIHDTIDATYVLDGGRGGPSRNGVRPLFPVVYRKSAPRRDRPDLSQALEVPPVSVRRVSRSEGERLIDLAREAMVTRKRDLDAFTWGNPRDVRVIEENDGLAFAMIGVIPEKRLPLPAVHGWLTLRNGVPTGYVQTDTLLDTSEVSFNTFETFRATDAAHVFARVLAITHHVLGARSFTIEPYQLGHGNDEGLQSGAWWFYAHLGFRPKDPKVFSLYRGELLKMKRNPKHRSSIATLAKLASSHLYWNESANAPAILPGVPQLGLRDPERVAKLLKALARAKAAPDEDKSLEGLRKLRSLARVLTS
ncbi:MAG TPA: hypothetical protein VJ826_06275 [Candidatus Polarisedimenticolaceae bacterium]|nr:hypothetical protein [Candidatus Polarisedimenticolaceae bacterium]